MGTVLVGWLALPAVLLALSIGFGELVRRVVRAPLGASVTLLAGFGAYLAWANLAIVGPVAARAVGVGAIVLAVAGWVLAWRRGALRPATLAPLDERAPLVGAALAYLLAGLPFLVAGHAAFGGYGSLGDGGFQMVGASIVPEVGATTHDLAPSAARQVMVHYFADGYPSGALTGLGYPTGWLGTWPLVTYQPFQVLLLAVGGLGMAVVARESAGLRGRGLGLVALVAGAAPLTAAFALQGSIKEVGGAALFAALAGALAWAWPSIAAGRIRSTLPAGLLAGAAIGVVGPGIGPLLLLFAALLAGALAVPLRRSGRWRRPLAAVLLALAVALVGNLPAVLAAVRVSDVAGDVLTAKEELGNLPGPLSWWKAVGGWDAYDYRAVRAYGHVTLAHASALVTIAAVLAALWVALRRRAAVLGALLVAVPVSTWYLVRIGSPWAGGKALAIAALPLWGSAAIGALSAARGALGGRGTGARPIAVGGRATAVVLVAVVLVTAAFSYRGVRLSPPERFDELRALAGAVDDRPVLVAEFDEFAKAAFVDRRSQTLGENPFDAWPLRMADGSPVPPTTGPPLDALDPEALAPFGWVVVRRGPSASWPGPAFALVRTTAHYWLFRRTTDRLPRVWRPVRAEGVAVDRTPCRRIERLGPRGFALVRPAAVAQDLTAAPEFWVPREDLPHIRFTRGTGAADQPVDVPATGRYRVWLQGSFNRRTTIAVEGRSVGAIPRGATNQRVQAEPVGGEAGVEIAAGRRVVRVERRGGAVAPGTGRNVGAVGRLWLEPVARPRLVAARDLPCDRDGRVAVDWYGRW